MSQPGDINLNNFTIGPLNALDASQCNINFINIYEDITSPVFLADAEINDYSDCLGRYMISGKENVSLSFSVPGIDTQVSLSLSLLMNEDIDDKTNQFSGSMKYKTYNLKMVSNDVLKNQAFKLAQSFNTQTSDIVKQALSTITNAPVNTPDPTTSQRRFISNNEYVYDFLHKLEDEHVSQQYKSSLYTLFADRMSGSESRTFCTFEYLMSQASKQNYVQDSTMGGNTISRKNAMYNLLWVLVPHSFTTPIVWNSASKKQVYNQLTGKGSSLINIPSTSSSGVILGNSITNGILSLVNASLNPQMRGNIVQPENDSQTTGVADAKIARANYMKDLVQNSVTFEINGNPSLSVGHVININIPKKAPAEWSDGEQQINSNVLITKIRHKIGPLGLTPRYTMICEAVKAAYAQGGA